MLMVQMFLRGVLFLWFCMRALWLHIFVVTVVLRIECVCTFTFSIKKSQWRSAITGDDIRMYNMMYTNNRNQNVNEPADPEVDSNARCVVPQNITLDILYEDPDMLVLNKASGMIMQFVPDSVENAVVFHLNSTESQYRYATPSWPWKSQDSFEGIVHRIDKETSGILVVAKHPLAARALHASFQERRVHKTYLAIAVGLPTATTLQKMVTTEKTPQQIHIQLPLAKPHLQRLSKEIKNCGRNVTKALELLNQSSDTPNAVCYNAAISVCKRAGERNKALSTFDSMKERGVTPNIKCFMKAINLCAKEPPLYEKAIELVGYMGECNLPLNPHCVSSAISACGRAGQLEPALELLRLVVEERSADSPDGMPGCYKAAISACKRCEANDSALALNDQLRALMSGTAAPRENVTRAVELPILNEEIVVDAPMGKMGSRRRLMGILPKSQGGREARSIVSPVAFDGTLSLNSVVIETGRTHQIRVHMSSVLGCPLVGDQMYNDDDPIQRAERCMLHAAELTVPHPTTGAMLRISCPPPPDFFALAEKIRASSSSVQ